MRFSRIRSRASGVGASRSTSRSKVALASSWRAQSSPPLRPGPEPGTRARLVGQALHAEGGREALGGVDRHHHRAGAAARQAQADARRDGRLADAAGAAADDDPRSSTCPITGARWARRRRSGRRRAPRARPGRSAAAPAGAARAPAGGCPRPGAAGRPRRSAGRPGAAAPPPRRRDEGPSAAAATAARAGASSARKRSARTPFSTAAATGMPRSRRAAVASIASDTASSSGRATMATPGRGGVDHHLVDPRRLVADGARRRRSPRRCPPSPAARCRGRWPGSRPPARPRRGRRSSCSATA